MLSVILMEIRTGIISTTVVSKEEIGSILGNKDEDKMEMVQFHQSYSYEDFVMGYKPMHPRGAFILVGDCTPTKTNLLLVLIEVGVFSD